MKDRSPMKINLNRVESIVHNDILVNKRGMTLLDYEQYIEDGSFYNDLEHQQLICSVDELVAAINSINQDNLYFNRVILKCWNGDTLYWQVAKNDFVLYEQWQEENHDEDSLIAANTKKDEAKYLGTIECYEAD